MHRTYIEFISTCDVCLIFSLRCISHLCRHAVYIALVECHIHRIWSLRVLHPPELQSDRCWMQYYLHSGQCDVYLIFKNRIYVLFLESHLCRIRYHMRRTSHLLIAINTASASRCRIRRICGMQALYHLESPPLTSRWTASDKNRTSPSTPNFSGMLPDLGIPAAGKSRIRPYPSALSPRNRRVQSSINTGPRRPRRTQLKPRARAETRREAAPRAPYPRAWSAVAEFLDAARMPSH